MYSVPARTQRSLVKCVTRFSYARACRSGKKNRMKGNGRCMSPGPRGLTGFPAKKLDSRSTLVEGKDSRR